MWNRTVISMLTATGVLLATLSVPNSAMADSGFIKTKASAVEHSVENEGGLIKVRDHRRKSSHRRHKSRNRHRGRSGRRHHRGHGGHRHGYGPALIGGLIIGGIIADQAYRVRYYDNYNSTSNAHLDWCYNRYRSYRDRDNTFQPYNGPRRQCISPYYAWY